MPCNLAVTITKAAVLPDHLLSLLNVDIVQKVVTAYLTQHPEYKNFVPLRSRAWDDTVMFHLGSLSYRIIITKGEVQINFPTYAQDKATKLSEELVLLLSKAADKLFAAQVQQALLSKFGTVQTQSTKVENQGDMQHVTVFTLEV